MSYSKEELIQYRVKRAFETLAEANLLAKEKHWNTVANRLYYSCYYAVAALMVKNNLTAGTHSGVKIEFHKNYIKNGLIDEKYGKFYSSLFNKRQEGDYEDFMTFQEEDIRPMINTTEEFLKIICTQLGLDEKHIQANG